MQQFSRWHEYVTNLGWVTDAEQQDYGVTDPGTAGQMSGARYGGFQHSLYEPRARHAVKHLPTRTVPHGLNMSSPPHREPWVSAPASRIS